MVLRVEKILLTLWCLCISGSIILNVIYIFSLGYFSDTYFKILFLQLFGLLPYTLVHRYIPQKIRGDFLFINVCFVIAGLSLSFPFYNYFFMIFLPLTSILFNSRRVFYISCLITTLLASYLVFFRDYQEEVSILQGIIDITFLLTYLVILDLVMKANAQFTKTTYIYDKTVNTLILAVEAKDDYTRGHSIRVSDYAMILGQYMSDLGYKIDLESLRISSILHDIGKINIPQDILSKEGKLTLEEYNTIKQHSQYGADLAKDLGYPSHIVESILSHHERFDGRGYPEGKADQDTPINAKIIAIADTFDALTSNRSYRKAFSVEEARVIVLDSMGTQFNAKFKPVFEAVYPKFVEYQANVKNSNQKFSKVV
jgi:putative nucleotidyltransferase with HDIG domain